MTHVVYCHLSYEQSRQFTVIHQNKRAGGEMRGLFSCCAAAFGGNMRFLLRRRLSRTDRCQSDGKSKKEQCGWGMSLRCSHDCLRGVDYLLYLFGRAFIALTRSLPLLLGFAFRSLSFDHEST